jgi:transposase
MREIFVGVDVAKAELVVACRPEGAAWTASNDAEGIAATVARLTSLEPRLIVLEATGGGYERAVVAALAVAG